MLPAPPLTFCVTTRAAPRGEASLLKQGGGSLTSWLQGPKNPPASKYPPTLFSRDAPHATAFCLFSEGESYL